LGFWQLSDALITAIIGRHIPVNLPAESRIMDAGGGTGRWITELANIYKSRFVLYDLSEDMLEQAKININKANLQERVEIIQGDLVDMSAIEDGSIDHIVSIYSPLSFIDEKEKAIAQLYRKLKKGGVLIIMGHGYYNAIASKVNNYGAPAEELKTLNSEMQVKWAPYVPTLNIFSKESMELLLEGAGFSSVTTYGVPVFAQPGPEDFDPTNSQRSRISQALENPDFFETVFNLEMKHNSRPDVANRGVNIFSVAKKS
ncbi:MAG: class I SAM-dependent methyltransferase, partial [Candidatus Uhrbacteria bacterium]|nr:class I SAM-dependent methyltransferase [Candidatus Uhrbacteria bacterium]